VDEPLPGLGRATRASLLDVIVGQSPVGVGVFDLDRRYAWVNPALQSIVGLSPGRMIGRRVLDVVPGPIGAFVDGHVTRVLATGVPVVGAEVEGWLPGSTRERSLTASYFRLTDDAGRVLGAASIVSDVSDRYRTRRELERAGARLELLGRAGQVLSESLDLEQTLAGLGRLVVPDLADHCVVDLVEEGGRIRRYAVVHADGLPARQDDSWTPVGSQVEYPPGHPVRTALDSGEPQAMQVDPARFDYAAVAPTPGSAEYARRVGVRSALTLPLLARGRIVGVVSFARSATGRDYDGEDRLLAGQLADRAAVAIDNARLYGNEQRRALALQRRLLPARLPDVQGVRAASRYLPATGGQVGGDWYDLVRLPGGRVAIVVGDVMGRGTNAAALMGQVRAALRGYAVQDLPPADVLTAADELVRGLDDDTIVTCVYAVLDPRDGRLAVANAGHVPPLLVGAGPPGRPLAATGPPLGAGGREPYTQEVARVGAGDVLALYTDGLVETREDDLDAGIARVRALLDPAPDDLDAACDVLTGSLAPASHDDDLAVLLLRLDPAAAPPAHRAALPRDPVSARRGRSFTRQVLRDWDIGEEAVDAAELAVSELVTNAVRHGGGEVSLQLSLHGDGVVVEVDDGARGSPRWRRATPDDEGGRGLMLVGEVSHAWGSRESPAGGTTVWCRIQGSTPTGSPG
jgi:PAS domain S-box-containing protein